MTILVCISAHPKSYTLLRVALKKLQYFQKDTELVVLYVETSNHYTLNQEARERILRIVMNAEEVGARIVQIQAGTELDGIQQCIRELDSQGKTVKHIIMGRINKDGFLAELRPTLSEKLARQLRHSDIEIQIVPLSGHHYTPSWFERLQLRSVSIRELAFGLCMTMFAYLASEVLRYVDTTGNWDVNRLNVTAFFLIATVIVALRHGLIAGLFTAIISFLTIDLLYIAPFYSLNIDTMSGGVVLAVFLFSAIVVTITGAFSRANTKSLARKEKRSQALYNIHRLTNRVNSKQQALAILHNELSSLLEMEVHFYLPGMLNPDTITLAYPEQASLSESDQDALIHCWEQIRTTGFGTRKNFMSNWRFEPMVAIGGEIGVLSIKVPRHIRLDPSFGRLVSAVADQAASVLERIELNERMSKIQISEEREKLRAMLLSSVSHDLKTPLASIIGSLSVFKHLKRSDRLTDDISTELTETALDEAQRLDSFISNILDMTRIESGDIDFNIEWSDPEECLNNVKKRLRQRLTNHRLSIRAFDNATDYRVEMDAMMTEQVLQNVIDNAAKYSIPDTTITVSYGVTQNEFVYIICDQGKGIPEEKLDSVFDKYERLKQSDSQVAGTGLGLAICRAVMEKQHGTITASNHPEGGAMFTLAFPSWRNANITEEHQENVA